MRIIMVLVWAAVFLTLPALFYAIIAPDAFSVWWSEIWQTVRVALWVIGVIVVGIVALLLGSRPEPKRQNAVIYDAPQPQITNNYYVENLYIQQPTGQFGELFSRPKQLNGRIDIDG